MIYQTTVSLELPIVDEGILVGYCPEIPATLFLDERGDLYRVQLHQYRSRETKIVSSGRAFDAALELMEADGDRIRDEAGFRGDRSAEPDAAPIYGVGFSGSRYAA